MKPDWFRARLFAITAKNYSNDINNILLRASVLIKSESNDKLRNNSVVDLSRKSLTMRGNFRVIATLANAVFPQDKFNNVCLTRINNTAIFNSRRDQSRRDLSPNLRRYIIFYSKNGASANAERAVLVLSRVINKRRSD